MRLLHSPVIDLYLAFGLHRGVAGQICCSGVPLKEMLDKPVRACSGDKFNLKWTDVNVTDDKFIYRAEACLL